MDVREKNKWIFNQEDNAKGKKIKLVLGTPASKEGVSFFSIKYVH